ncbi:YceI family protein [Aquiflexum sp. TKW24L]|uniref:YceI family protein n=1 Tax=Aquiflexum sp. TKW24L TaxID=2942212 RepID=UPI0020BFAE6F|nr:YceI family protein [Aquiflexum sp. TKW24L]MCL6258363.1 YceI family protein [Aquiflexum sp. TKW24L]
MNVNFLISLVFLIQFQAFCQKEKGSDPIVFEIKNAGITVEGTISDWEYEISFDPKRLDESSIKGVAYPVSMDTGIKLRDKHLQGRQYFHVDKFPEILITSKKITTKGKGSYMGVFDLTIKEVKKEIEIPFMLTSKGNTKKLIGDFTINRLDYGIGESSIVLGDEVKVKVNINF